MRTIADAAVFVIAVAFAAGIAVMLHQSGKDHMNDWREVYQEEFYKQEVLRRQLIEKEQEDERNGTL